jgi:hypothetical protein
MEANGWDCAVDERLSDAVCILEFARENVSDGFCLVADRKLYGEAGQALARRIWPLGSLYRLSASARVVSVVTGRVL